MMDERLKKLFGDHLPSWVVHQDGRGTNSPRLLFADADYEIGDGSTFLHESSKQADEPAIIFARADSLIDAFDEITALRAQLAAAEADKLAAMERVREAAARHILKTQLGVASNDAAKDWINGNNSAVKASAAAIRALDLDALAEGEE